MILIIEPLEFKSRLNLSDYKSFEAERFGYCFCIDKGDIQGNEWHLTIEQFKKTIYDEWFATKELAIVAANDYLESEIRMFVSSE